MFFETIGKMRKEMNIKKSKMGGERRKSRYV